MESSKPKLLRFFAATAKSVPVLTALCTVAWSYYAYVYHLCLGKYGPASDGRRRRRRARPEPNANRTYLFPCRPSDVGRGPSAVPDRVPRRARVFPVVVRQDGVHRAERNAARGELFRPVTDAPQRPSPPPYPAPDLPTCCVCCSSDCRTRRTRSSPGTLRTRPARTPCYAISPETCPSSLSPTPTVSPAPLQWCPKCTSRV